MTILVTLGVVLSSAVLAWWCWEALKLVRDAWRAWFPGWWMSRVAGRYCPCEWPIRSQRLIRWCGRVDDKYERQLSAAWVRGILHNQRRGR